MRDRPRSSNDLRLGDRVNFRGHACYVRGFTPMGVQPTRLQLEDATTGERADADLGEITRAASHANGHPEDDDPSPTPLTRH